MMQRTRKMGVDYGDKRIGVALTDALCIISSPYEVFQNLSPEQSLQHLNDLIKQFNVDEVAMGLPLNMDGSEGERAKLHREIGQKLSELSGVKVAFVDERLTSAEAEEILIESNTESSPKPIIGTKNHKLARPIKNSVNTISQKQELIRLNESICR